MGDSSEEEPPMREWESDNTLFRELKLLSVGFQITLHKKRKAAPPVRNRPGVGYEGNEIESKNDIGILENILRKKFGRLSGSEEPPIYLD